MKKVLFIMLWVFMSFNLCASDQGTKEINLEAIESVERLISTEFESQEVAVCIEQVCCKTTFKGTKLCRVVCGFCPIGWYPE